MARQQLFLGTARDRAAVVERVEFDKLNAKQKEIYNFQKLAGLLADYGFNCIKLPDDWQGADFLAHHKDGSVTLRVQLKGRVGIHEKYRGKDLHLAFPADDDGWYLLPHDELIVIAAETTDWLKTSSWRDGGFYHSARPPGRMLERLEPYELKAR